MEDHITESNTGSAPQPVPELKKELSLEYILGCIQSITLDKAYLQTAVSALCAQDSSPAAKEQAAALTGIVTCRETTNQQLLVLLSKMYDDLNPDRISAHTAKIARILDSLEKMNLPPDIVKDIVQASLES